MHTSELPSSTATIRSSQKTIDRMNLDFFARRSTVFLALLYNKMLWSMSEKAMKEVSALIAILVFGPSLRLNYLGQSLN